MRAGLFLLAMSVVIIILCPHRAHAGDPEPKGFVDALQRGWSHLQAGEYTQATDAYAGALRLESRSEDACLGLQTARAALEQWEAAAAVGERCVAMDPKSFLAVSRLAWARYRLADFGAAAARYRQALVLEPGDEDMQRGLNLSLARERRLRGWTSASTSLYWATGGSMTGLQSLTVAGGAAWPSGLELWGGVTLSRATLNIDETETFQQATAVVGGALQLGRWRAELGLAGVFADDDVVDWAVVALGRVSYRDGAWGGGLGVAISSYANTTVMQLDPRLDWTPARWVSLSLGPSLSVVDDDRAGDSAAEALVSVAAEATVRIRDDLQVRVSGFFGPQRYRVEAGGLSVWSGSDTFAGGYRASVTWKPLGWLGLYGQFEHRFGSSETTDENGEDTENTEEDFQLLGATFGVRLSF